MSQKHTKQGVRDLNHIKAPSKGKRIEIPEGLKQDFCAHSFSDWKYVDVAVYEDWIQGPLWTRYCCHLGKGLAQGQIPPKQIDDIVILVIS